MKKLALLVSHLVAVGLGFAIGVYALPILVAPQSPTASEATAQSASARFTGEFRRNLKGSDLLHWGEGVVAIGEKTIVLKGELAPGPDYKLYLSPEFVETEEDFMRLKASMVRVGDVKTFKNFIVDIPASVEPARYTAVVVWCETFSQFITAARYRQAGQK